MEGAGDPELEPQDLQLGTGVRVRGAYIYPKGRSLERDGARELARELALDTGRGEMGGGTGSRRVDVEAGLPAWLCARD
jgi:hypothetical protein